MSDIPALSDLLLTARLSAGLSQRELAERAGTSQPAIARLERGDVSPTLSTLQRLAAAAGYELRVDLVPNPASDPVVDAYKKDVDRTLLRENLRRTVEERLRSLDEFQQAGNALQQATGKATRKAPRRT